MEVSNKERKEHKKHKKSKKHKEHKEHKDKKRKHEEEDVELNIGSFKKALVTPTLESLAASTAVPPTSSRPVTVGSAGSGSLEELGLFGGGDHSSAEEDSSSDEDEATAQSKVLQKARSVNDATMAAVADLLTATTGSTSGTGGVSADVIKMQQQLQQQIPFTASSTSTATASSAEQLTREEILESIAGIPAMQMLLQQDGLATAAQPQQHQDANAILMSLSNDPSILATVNSTEHQPTLGQIMQREAAAASGLPVLDGKSSSTKKKKAAAAAGPKRNTRTGVPAVAAANAANARSLEEQMDYDLNGSSDSILHTKWMMATELKERGKQCYCWLYWFCLMDGFVEMLSNYFCFCYAC